MSESPHDLSTTTEDVPFAPDIDAEALAECMARHPAGKRRALDLQLTEAGGRD